MPGDSRKAVDERLYLSKAKGGGILRREIWVDREGRVVRYNLAYINPLLYPGDRGRVLGYDSGHGAHHRHYKGRVTTVSITSFEEAERRFEQEWTKLVKHEKH